MSKQTEKRKLEYIAIDALKEYERNTRTHSDEQVEQLKRSITAFGFTNPVLIDENNEIIAGHGRRIAAHELGMSEVPCLRLIGLTESQKKALRIADNQLALNAGWDEEMLRIELADLKTEDFNLDLIGFSIDELEQYLGEYEQQKEVVEDEAPSADEVKRRCKRGEIWQLGNHRLMCGDSTSANDVAKLMDGEKADITFTSPPYNMSGGFATSHKQKLYANDSVYQGYSDDLNDAEYLGFLQKALDNGLKHSDDVLFNVGWCKGALIATAKLLGDNADKFGGVIVWKKSGAFNPVFDVQLGCLANICEPIYIFNCKGARKLSHPTWDKSQASYNLIETANAGGNEYSKVHKATFPIALPFEALKRFSQKSVLDLFGGTGTTLIAAEQLGRKCYMMELSEQYCDIILTRWEDLTGKTAKKIK